MEDLLINLLACLVNSTTTDVPSVMETVLAEIRAASFSQMGSMVMLHLEDDQEVIQRGASSDSSASSCVLLMLTGGNRKLNVELGRRLHTQGPNMIPNCLREFLADPTFTFLVIRADAVIGRLRREYGLVCNRFVEVGPFAADYFGEPGLRTPGMEELGRRVVRDYCTRRPRGRRGPNN